MIVFFISNEGLAELRFLCSDVEKKRISARKMRGNFLYIKSAVFGASISVDTRIRYSCYSL